MALIDTVPTTKVVLPSIVKGYENGDLPLEIMRNFDGRGWLLEIVSYGMQALHIAAWHDQIDGFGPIDTETVGRYRSYVQQVAALTTRADRGYIAGRKWYRTWNGSIWSGKPGTAPVATPRFSNHGWAAADDVAEERTGDNVPDGMSDRQLRWMRDNAPDFGFGLESRVERWHWHWISGDVLPARAIAVLTYAGIAVPTKFLPPGPPPIPPEFTDMDEFIIRLKGYREEFLVQNGNPVPLSPALAPVARASVPKEYQFNPTPDHPETRKWLEFRSGLTLSKTADGS